MGQIGGTPSGSGYQAIAAGVAHSLAIAEAPIVVPAKGTTFKFR